jgi:hypothetical protein
MEVARGPTGAAAATALEEDRKRRGYQHPEDAAAVGAALAELQASLAAFVGGAQVSVAEILGGVGEGTGVLAKLEAAAQDVRSSMESDDEALVDAGRCVDAVITNINNLLLSMPV